MVNNTNQSTVMLVKPIYPCQNVPVVVFSKRCPKPCLYCDLCKRDFPKNAILASGKKAVLEKLKKSKGAYFSAVSDCFLPTNRELTHNIIKNVWKAKPNFVPLIVTKQSIPQKTINLFIKNKQRIVMQISTPSLNNKLLSILEPGGASVSKRLKTIEKLTKGGVSVTAVVMPWFNIYTENENITDLPKELAKVGVTRCIIGTGVLPPNQRQKMINTNNKAIQYAVKQMTEERKVTTKIGYTLPIKERILLFSELISAFSKFGIKARICTADNADLIDKVKLPLCTKFKHPYFLS